LKMCGIATSMIFIGIAIGGPVNAWMSQAFNIRRLVLVGFAVITSVLFSLMLFIPMHYIWVAVICFLLGLFSSSYILIFAVVKECTGKELRGASLATANMVLMSSAPIIQALIGWVLSQQVSYEHALSIINVLLYLAILFAWPLKDKSRA